MEADAAGECPDRRFITCKEMPPVCGTRPIVVAQVVRPGVSRHGQRFLRTFGESEVEGAGEELFAAIGAPRGQQLLRADHAEQFAFLVAEEVLPGPSIQSDADLITDFRKRSGTVYHPVSTCRMGPDAAAAVVDPRLKVHGLEGLRVIDASIFPANITGNTNAAAIMTGWKGAELVLEDQK